MLTLKVNGYQEAKEILDELPNNMQKRMLRTALKKLETDLAKKRKELALLETEEKGVLNTISLLDQNLNQTRTYIQELSKSIHI